MPSPQEVYTYRAGQKLPLRKRPDQFIVRALPEQLASVGITAAERLSSQSSRVTCRASELEPLMTQARHLAPTFHAYENLETGEDFLITDRVLISFQAALTDVQLGEFAGRYGLIQREQYSPQDFLFQLTEHTGINPVKLVVLLTESEPLVQEVDHDLNYLEQPYSISLPTDPGYRQQWHLHEQLQNINFDQRASTRCEKAWQLLGHFGSSEIVIGLSDDGCKVDHPDFNSANKFAGWGYFDQSRLVTQGDIDAQPQKMYQSGNDHGTACAGVIAAEIDATLTVGAAPGCRLLPIKWQSEGGALFISDSKLLTALTYLDDKIDVMSNSWGSTPVTAWSNIVIRRITELAETGGRRGQGIVFLWAAGNENCPVDHVASIEVPYTSGWDFRPNGSQVWVGVQTTRFFRNNLAAIPGVLIVAAINSLAQRSHYSNYGKGVSVCAPSNNGHTYGRLPVRGLGVTTTSGFNQLYTNDFGGTSSATPLVAGIAGLVLSANPTLTALEVVSILKQTAAKDLNFEGYARTPTANYDPFPSWDVSPIAPFGRGEFQETSAPEGTWSPWFGHGKVDALAAVTAARNLIPEVPETPETSKVLVYESAPALMIPDNVAAGVQDQLLVAESNILQDLQVTVAITHPWIGDLRVQLVSPDGTTVVLHDRTGSNADNIQTTYTLASLPALASFKDRTIQGPWQLKIQDLAAQDVGRLDAWTLALTTVGNGGVTVEDAEGVTIPDFNPQGIMRSQTLPDGLVAQDLAVFVDITHPNIADLRVSLITPQGLPLTLHNQTGSGLEHLSRTWHSTDSLELSALQGKQVGGTWQLRVADLTSQHQGKLNRWRLAVNAR